MFMSANIRAVFQMFLAGGESGARQAVPAQREGSYQK